MGKHWVRAHARKVQVSEQNPDGLTQVRGTCRTNPSRHEIFVAEEFREIAEQNFAELTKMSDVMPTPDALGFPNGNEFDLKIAGWTKFWNDIFQPEEKLDPDLVKALIASESSFVIEVITKSNAGDAHGLIQITEQTRKILKNQKGELKDFLIDASNEDLLDPDVNLATGIRWLFHKKALAERRLKRSVTWDETISEYKGITGQEHERALLIMAKLRKYLVQLKRSRSS